MNQPELVDATVYYLEMCERPQLATLPAPRDDLSIRHIVTPTVPFYRALYDAVGGPYRWLSRRKMSDEALGALLADPRIEMHVLYVADREAGFAELDRRVPDDVELVQFGLVGEFIGQGLGKWFLQWTIDRAWSDSPRRFWLHTCTLDHPAALPNYQRAGFRLYDEQMVRREW